MWLQDLRLTRSVTQPSRFSMTATEKSRPYLCMRMSRKICSSIQRRGRENFVYCRSLLGTAWIKGVLTSQLRPRCSVYDADECTTKNLVRGVQTRGWLRLRTDTFRDSRIWFPCTRRWIEIDNNGTYDAQLTSDQGHQTSQVIVRNKAQGARGALHVYPH